MAGVWDQSMASGMEREKLTCRLNAAVVSGTGGGCDTGVEVEVVRLGRASTREAGGRAESRLDRRSAAAVGGDGKWSRAGAGSVMMCGEVPGRRVSGSRGVEVSVTGKGFM